jgi:hypothetical protein
MRLISVRTLGGDDALGVTAGSSWMPAADLDANGPATMQVEQLAVAS